MTDNDSGWREPLVRRLVRRHRSRSPEGAIAQEVRRILAEAGQTELPIDVEGIASLLGIKRRLIDAPFAARIYVDPSGQLVMDLRATDGEPRRRFSCAHEVIHTLFPGFRHESRYRVDVQTSDHRRERSEEEYLCDYGASELLMPVELLSAPALDLGNGLIAVENLAEDAAVSLEAAGNRLVGLSLERVAFLVLEVGHKPADARRIARGEQVAPRLRMRYSTSSPRLPLFVPRHKSADAESPLVTALATDRTISSVGPIPGSGDRLYRLEAKAYPFQLNGASVERVLALAWPTSPGA